MMYDLRELYLEWLCEKVTDNYYHDGHSYRKLMHFLMSINFYYSIPMDGNRADDGMDLRYRFGYETNREDVEIATLLDVYPCSVLEMLVALAIRCEEQLMFNPEAGNRTDIWFWDMLTNLKLDYMDDEHYSENEVRSIIFKWLNHEYSPNGEGGLFTIRNPKRDLRGVEIWYQLNWHLAEYDY